jgi:hypothetical protein
MGGAATEWAGFVPEVRGRHAHRETRLVERVAGFQVEHERVAGLRKQPQAHGHGRRRVIGRRPARPAGEAMDGIPALGLGQRQPMICAAEPVRPVLDAIGPRQQELPAPAVHPRQWSAKRIFRSSTCS